MIALLPEKANEFYPLSDFSKQFTNFKDSFRFDDREISDTFKIHMQHFDFDFLPVFKFAKSESIGQNFKDYFFRYLSENDTEVFPTEKKHNEEKT